MAVHMCLYLPVFDCICLPVFACICLYLPAAAARLRGHNAVAALKLWHIRCAVTKRLQHWQSICRQIASFIRTGQHHYSCSLQQQEHFWYTLKVLGAVCCQWFTRKLLLHFCNVATTVMKN
jgi:hypothetical protein